MRALPPNASVTQYSKALTGKIDNGVLSKVFAPLCFFLFLV